MSDNSTKICTNCKYFKRHYVIADRGKFVTTRMGHCVNYKVNDYASAKHVKKNEGCALWQPHELQKLNIQYGVEQSLQNISDRVNEILAILRDAE